MIDQVFSKKSGFCRFGAVVIYPIKKDWKGNERILSLEDVKRVAVRHAKRRELTDNVDVVDLSFNRDLQIYVAVYGHLDREAKTSSV